MTQPGMPFSTDSPREPLHHNPTTQWSWAAFLFYPVWGICNGLWWALPIGLLLGWLWPLPNFVFAVSGRQWAWKRRQWQGIAHFAKTQKRWDRISIAVALLMAGVVAVAGIIVRGGHII